jgi:ABC-type sugar transport system substrate-binding protein
MKKVLVLILAMCMALSLAACGGKDATPETPETPAAPESSAPVADDGGAQEVPPVVSGEDSAPADDPFARDPYKIAYVAYSLGWAWNKQVDEALSQLGKKYNFEYVGWGQTSDDNEAYLNQIYVFADQGYDGLILATSDALTSRAYEICKEVEIPFVAESTAFLDENGNCIWPSVQQNNIANGKLCVDWLYENYKTYWGDIDTTKLGLVGLDFSAISGITERSVGVKGSFEENFPDAAANYFWTDCTPLGMAGMSVQAGTDLTTTVISSNPQIEHWFVVTNIDDWASGATRAAELLGVEDRVLVVSVQADAFLAEQNSGYTGNVYVAANAVSSTQFAVLCAENLITILDGKATAETIWPEWITGNDKYARYQVTGQMITRDTYKDYVAGEEAKLK